MTQDEMKYNGLNRLCTSTGTDTKMSSQKVQEGTTVSQTRDQHFAPLSTTWESRVLWLLASLATIRNPDLFGGGKTGSTWTRTSFLFIAMSCEKGAYGSYTEMFRQAVRQRRAIQAQGIPVGPLPQDWQTWDWVTLHAGVRRPQNGLDQRWQLLRTTDPIIYQPDRATIWVLGRTTAVEALRRIESIWNDLIAYDGIRMFWKAYTLHEAAQESRTLDDAAWRAIVVTQNDEAHMTNHAPMYYDVRKRSVTGTTDQGAAIYAPRLITVAAFLQKTEILPLCIKRYQCTVFLDAVQVTQAMNIRPGSYVLVAMENVELEAHSDEEMEEPMPIAEPFIPESSSTSFATEEDSVHTPTTCGMLDMGETWHIYRPDFYNGRRRELIFTDTGQRSDLSPEIEVHWPDVDDTPWHLIPLHAAYHADHPTEQSCTTLMLHVPRDFLPTNTQKGIVILYLYMHVRSTRSFPMTSPLTLTSLWQWAGLELQCTRSTSWECFAFLNGDRLLPGMQYNLDHGDYMRIQIEAKRERGGRGELMPLDDDELNRKIEAQGSAEHDRWPKDPHGRQERPGPSVAPTPRTHDHAEYWIYMAWMMIVATGPLIRMQCPSRRRKATRPKPRCYRKPIRSMTFIYLLLSAQIGDAVQVRITDGNYGESTRSSTTTSSQQTSWAWEIDTSPTWSTFELLPPPGNPDGVTLTPTGQQMMGWIADFAEIEWRKRQIWTKLTHGRDDRCPTFFLPPDNEKSQSLYSFDFEHNAMDSQVSPLVCAQAETTPILPILADTRTRISIDAALGLDVTNGRDGSDRDHDIDYTQNEILSLCRSWTWSTVPTLSHLPDRPSCVCPDHLVPVCHGDPLDNILIYTDGSYDARQEAPNATWAFAVFRHDANQQQLQLIDWYADYVCEDPMDPNWIGATDYSIRAGEATALLWTNLWLCTQGKSSTAHIYSDALSVLRAGTGQWNFCLYTLMTRLRATTMLTSTIWKNRQRQTDHVKSHNGNVGNEIADLIAVSVRKGTLQPRTPPCSFPTWFHGTPPKISHAWLLWDALLQDERLPPIQQGQVIPSPPMMPTSMPLWMQFPGDTPCDDTSAIRCASFNVHTLKMRGAITAMRHQCEERGIHIIGLQETRTADPTTIDTSYLRFVAPSEKGNGGIELWLSTKTPIKTSRGCTHLRRDDVLILHTSPTLLVATIKILGRSTTCVVAHAPHRGHKTEDILQWWQETTTHLSKHHHQEPILLMIDANATVQDAQPHIGPVGAEEVDTGGRCLSQFCQTFDIALPSTFANLHFGDNATMFGYNATHRGIRNDYVGISLELLDWCTQSWIDASLDAGHGKIDHAAVVLDLHWPALSFRAPMSSIRFDRHKITMATPEQWTEFFSDWPVIPWSTDITTHVQQIEQHIGDRLAQTFPKDPHYKKGSCMTEKTRDTYLQRRHLRNTMNATKGKCEQWVQQYGLARWCGRNGYRIRFKILALALRASWRWMRYKSLSQRLQHQLRADQNQWLEERMTILETTAPKEIPKFLKPLRMGKRVRHLGLKPLPQVRMENGELATNHEQAQQRWRSHFAAMEGGCPVTMEQLWHEQLDRRDDHEYQSHPLDAIPSVFELEYFMRQSKSNKAMGWDAIPGELLRQGAPQLSYHMWPVLAKMAMWIDEPLQWKGGKLITAYKQKGSAQECNSHRALLVSSSMGKAMHNVWRRRVYPFVQSGSTSLQFSAHHRALVSQASHCARLFAQQAEYHDRSCFLIFLDIQSAYYQLIRQHAVDLTMEDSDVMRFLTRMGVDPMHIEELAHILSQPSALTELQCPPHLHSVVSEIHRATWWTLRADETIIRTSKGTRPGDGFADILWALCFSRYLHRINDCLEHLGICRPLAWNGEHGFFSEPGDRLVPGGAIVWADDAVVAADTDDVQRLAPMIKVTMEVIITELLRLGMRPNMTKGKTEAMLLPRGHGSRKVKQYVHCYCKGQIALDMENPEHQVLRIIPRYVHLGGVLTHDGRIKQEIRRRLAMAHDALHPYRTKVFRNQRISLSKRVRLIASVAIPALTYNVGTWPQLLGSELRLWTAGVFRLYKTAFTKLYNTETQFHMTDEHIIGLTGLPHPELLLRIQRVKQFGHYLQRQCDYFWALAGQDQRWLQTVHRDLCFLHDQVRGFTRLPVPDDENNIHEWQQCWTTRPSKIKGLIRRAQAHHIGQTQLHDAVTEFHDRMYDILSQAGLRHPGALSVQPATCHFCFPCNRAWPTYRAWAMHAFKRHGRISKYRRLQAGTRCEACGTDFPTHARLCRHLRSAKYCAETVAAERRWTEAGLVTGNREADRLDEQNCLIPSIATEGPILPKKHGWAMTEQVYDILQLFSSRDWDSELQPETEELMEAIQTTAIHPAEIAEVIEAQIHYYDKETATERLRDFHQRVQDRIPTMETQAHIQTKLGKKKWQDEQESFYYVESNKIPHTPTRYLYVVHLFSGIKRAGDLHSCINELVPPNGCTYMPISLDVVLDEQRGNLMDQANQEFWIRQSLAGKLHATVAGPPCETWSVARWRYYDDGEGPRPLRRSESVWGLPILKLRELRQILTGNCLLHLALLMAAAQAVAGNLSFVEHPSEGEPRKQGTPPCIWKLPVMKVMLQHPHMWLHHLYQGLYGARSPKPTSLLIVSDPSRKAHIENVMEAGRTTSTMPPPLRMSRTATGFSTAPLKRYPIGFCRALARAIQHGKGQIIANNQEEDDISEVAHIFQTAYECTHETDKDGHDFFVQTDHSHPN